MFFYLIVLQLSLCFLAAALDATQDDDGLSLDTLKGEFYFYARKYAIVTLPLCMILAVTALCFIVCIRSLVLSIRSKNERVDLDDHHVELKRQELRTLTQQVYHARSIEQVRTILEDYK